MAQDRANEFHLRVATTHQPDQFDAVAWSPVGAHIATASSDNTVRIWEAGSGKLLRTLEGHADLVLGVRWSPDGTQVVSGSHDRTVRIWEAGSGKLLRTLVGHTYYVYSVSWSADGTQVASGSYDDTVRIWEAVSGRLVRTLEGRAFHSVSWSADGTQVASGSDDNTVRIREAVSGRLVRTLEGHAGSVHSVSWSADGRLVASGSHDNTVRIWEAVSGKLLRTLESHADHVNSVSWSADGRLVASGSGDKTVRIWQAGSGRLVRTLEGHAGSVHSVSWSADGRLVASGSDETVRIWEARSGKLVRTIGGHTDRANGVSWSADGRLVASGSDETVRIWEARSGKLMRTLEGHTGSVHSVSWSSNGRLVASGSRDKKVRIWDVESGKLVRTLKGHAGSVSSVSWSADGGHVASGSYDNTVRIWEAGSGKLVRTLKGHAGLVFSVSWSPDGTQVVSGSVDDTVRIWEAGTGKLMWTLEGHAGLVHSVSWSGDGTRVVSGSSDKTVRIWDAGSGKLLRTLEGHSKGVYSVSWSADGTQVASGSHDSIVRIWDAGSGKLIREFEGAVRLPYHLLDVAFRARAALSPSFGTTALGDPNILVDVVEPVAEAGPAETISEIISAKVVLVGESNVGKSYLAHRIATGKAPEEGLIKSTHGMKFWPLGPEQLCVQTPADQRRDVVLWDMGGQEEYRLVHQLFLHDTTVALLLFDPTRGNTAFKEVATWNKYLTKQLREHKARKLLVGAKLDAPSDTLDRKGIEQTRVDTDCASFHETSAVTGRGVPELCTAVAAAIDWESLGTTSRPALFQRIRDEIEARRSRGEVVLYLSDLHRALGDEAAMDKGRKAIATVADQLATQGVIACSRMSTGEPVLVLQVQEIERYAGSLILAARNNPRNVPALELRAISLPGFTLPGIPEAERLNRTQETAVLDCTVELLLEHGICFAHEGLLVFPSLMAASADDDGETLPHAASLYYDISGAIDNIYASLVAWLVLAKDFGRLRLAPGRAEFEVRDQGLCGLRKVAKPGGFAHVDVYFEDKTPARLREDFIAFVEDHLSKQGVELCEHLVVNCPKGFVFDEETLRMAMAEGDRQVICPRCKSHHPLHEGAKEVRARNPKRQESLWGIRTRMEEARQAATRQAVQMVEQGRAAAPEPRSLRLLHLSDLHFTPDTPVFRRLQWLLDDVKRDKQDGGLGFAELDYLVVSGDFTDKANPQGFEKAYEFLSELSKAFKLTSERCVLVPGNHDVDEPLDAYTRRKDSSGLREGEWVKKDDLIMARDPVKYPLRLKPFSDGLYHKFLLTAYPMAPEEQGLSIPFWETGIQFLTFNSCWEIDEFHRKRAGIHPDAVAHATQQADQQVEVARAAGHLGKEQKPLRIAVWHHAVTPPDFKMSERDLDSLPHLQNHGVRLVLHGDAHDLRRDEVGAWAKTRIHVAGAGSFGAKAADKGEAVPRLYNVLEIARDFSSVTVHTRRQRTPDGDWDGYPEWPNPDGSNSRVAYYTIDLSRAR